MAAAFTLIWLISNSLCCSFACLSLESIGCHILAFFPIKDYSPVANLRQIWPECEMIHRRSIHFRRARPEEVKELVKTGVRANTLIRSLVLYIIRASANSR